MPPIKWKEYNKGALLGFADWLFGPIEVRADEPATPVHPAPAVTPPARDTTPSSVTPREAMTLAAAYRAVSILTTATKQLSVDVFRNGKEASAPAWVKRPDLSMPRSAFLAQTVASLATDGNAFWLVDRDGTGRVNALRVLDPRDVIIREDREGRATGYFFGGKEHPLADVQHLALLRIPGHARGLGPIQSAQAELRGALDVRDYSAGWFRDAGVPSGTLTTDQTLSPDAAATTRERWEATNGGKRGTAVLGNGVKYSPVLLSPSDAQFLETRQFTTTEIARLFGIPASMMLAATEGTAMTYSNIEQAWIEFVRFTLVQYLNEIEDAFSELLPTTSVAKFNIEALLRTDTKTRYEAHAIALAAGFLTTDEVRAIEGREPIQETTE